MSDPTTTTITAEAEQASPPPPKDDDAVVPSLIVGNDNNKEEEEPTSSSIHETITDDSNKESSSCFGRFWKWLVAFYWTNEFLILIVLVILLAKAYPPLGAIYLAPQITATWIAVMFIFLLAGLGLKTEEFSEAFQRVYFNTFVLVFNFGVDSSFVFGVSRLLTHYNVINRDLADGMVIAACLPLTINMCVVLTKASGGDEASAIFNSAFGNLIGVFLSPALILGYIGVSGTVSVWTVFYKLAVRVVAPIVVGQLLKWFCPPVSDYVKKYKPYFKQAQQYSLVFIVYTVFCRTFIDEDNQIPVKDIFLMIIFVFLCLGFLMILAWFLLKVLFGKEPKLRVMGLYGCTHKTVAMGIPLINAIFDGNPAIALYTLPLLIWHPMQLVIGTFLAPRLLSWVESFGDDENEGGEENGERQLGTDVEDKGDNNNDNKVGDEVGSQKSIEIEV